jgi:hypothetical protein
MKTRAPNHYTTRITNLGEFMDLYYSTWVMTSPRRSGNGVGKMACDKQGRREFPTRQPRSATLRIPGI